MPEHHRPNRITRASRWLTVDASRRDRLRDAMDVFRVRLEEHATLHGGRRAAWLVACTRCAEEVDEAIEDRDLDRGWSLLHAAERHEVEGLAEDALIARATVVRAEAASKLSDWRKTGVLAILELDDALAAHRAGKHGTSSTVPVGPADSMLRERLKQALNIRDDHFLNVYRKTAMRGEQLLITAFILTLVLVVVVAFAGDDPSAALGTPDALLRAMIFGALGAVLSTALSLAEDKMSARRIPDHLASTYVTLARPFFGAGFALVAYIAMRSGVLSVFDGSQAGLALACFLAGFSERWFLGIFDGAISKKGA